ncbi:hypothetical protein 9AX2_44 [uncultured Caudovirales phage]|uniref:Uncharacterized protein n=1 Tax=uncultured Caudovirales phage TaxID=2100421 RepID=A0A2H4J3A5_9CAUD|nr:hypothetical protein 9AX2_44 [uncultured Caudovirales phage]ONG71166.1 hypothetical protein BKK44_12360 [Bacillus cereus]
MKKRSGNNKHGRGLIKFITKALFCTRIFSPAQRKLRVKTKKRYFIVLPKEYISNMYSGKKEAHMSDETSYYNICLFHFKVQEV